MPLRDVLNMMIADIRSSKYEVRFQQARQRVSMLAPYDSAASLLDAIDARPTRRYSLGEPLLRALVGDYQRHPDSLVSGLLVALCTPMLEGLRSRLFCVFEDDELDQRVLCGFLEFVAALDLGKVEEGRTFVYMRTEFAKRMFRAVVAAHREQDREVSTDPKVLLDLLEAEQDEVEMMLWGPTPNPPPSPADREREVAAQTIFLLEHGSKVLDPDRLELVMHTHVLGGRLTDYVESRHSGLSSSQRRKVYQRDKRRHARAVHLLRETLAPLRRHRAAPASADSARSPEARQRVG